MELFTDKNGRAVQVGDVMVWEAEAGTARAVVTRYGVFMDWPSLFVMAPRGEAPLFRHQVAEMESEAAQ